MEMNGLYTVGGVFPECREAAEWRAYAAQRLYEELEERYIAGMTFGLPVAIGGADYRIRRNKLLVLINKHTEVVDEFGYRQEFNAR